MSTTRTFTPLRPARFRLRVSGLPQGLRRRAAGVRVPMREIALTNGESLRVYDSSGPHGHDVRDGLPKLREPWVAPRRGSAAPPVTQLALRAQGRDHAGDGVHRHPRGVRRRVRPLGGRARPRDHPRQHQPPRARADDHRPQLRGEDQRQHRQLRRHLVDRGGSRQAALGDAVGRRHGDGSVDRQATSTRRASGSSATPPCRSAPCRSTRRSRRSAAGPRI